MKTFYPLWIADVRWLHNRRDIYWRGGRAENSEWKYETNSWTHDPNGEWVFTNFTPSVPRGRTIILGSLSRHEINPPAGPVQ